MDIKRDRIRISLFAYAYEIKNDPLISDRAYDALAAEVEAQIREETDRPDLDFWFHDQFSCFTGMWVHQHPEIEKLERLYEKTKLHFR